jgi:hypothetical protein
MHSRKLKVKKLDKKDGNKLALTSLIFCKQSQVASRGFAIDEGQERKLLFRSPPYNKNHTPWILKPAIEKINSRTLPTHGSMRLLCHLKDTKKKYI